MIRNFAIKFFIKLRRRIHIQKRKEKKRKEKKRKVEREKEEKRKGEEEKERRLT